MKKQKQVKTELDYLKKINNTLDGIFAILVVLSIFITIAGIISIGINKNVTAEAAEENLLRAPITVATNEDNGIKSLDYSLGLEVGRSYRLSGTYGVDNTEFNKVVEYTMDSDGLYMLVWTFPDAESPEGSILVFDKMTMTEDEGPVYNENSALLEIGVNETLLPLTLNSITEYVEEQQVEAPQIIGNITNSFTGFLTGTGEGIVNFFEVVFTDGNGGISTLGIVGLTMMGLGLAVGIISVLMAKAKM